MSAGEIARLVDVGRAAVSNWRRRHDDFPQPVGGTAASPLFSLREVEEWLRRNGKAFRVSLADRVWQRLRAAGDDLGLGGLVAAAGAVLLRAAGGPVDRLPGPGTERLDDPELATMLTELAAERGHERAFEFLCLRYLDAHSRRLPVTPAEVAGLMVRLARTRGGTVLDPACGTGTLLLAAGARRVLGQDAGAGVARIAAARLLLRAADAHIACGDSLRHDGFPGAHADAVVCDPPFNDRAWGYPELAGDPRWEYGLPPRGESELAWVQHCLAHTRPGGLVAILMPGTAASRRPGRRIRANLLRAGALRAVVTLPDGGPDLWLLRRPVAGERPPTSVLLLAAADLADVEPAWERHLADPEAAPAVPVLDLLDDEVDVSPAGRSGAGQVAGEFPAARDRLAGLTFAPPRLVPAGAAGEPPLTTVGELVKAGLVGIRHAPARLPSADGELAVLTAEDLRHGGPPSGRTTAGPGLVDVEPGDVVASATGVARVAEHAAVLGPQLTRYRVERDLLDPDFLAGALRAAATLLPRGSSRMDARRARLPRLPLHEQRRYGEAFRGLTRLEDEAARAAELAGRLAGLGFAGLASGHLAPEE